MADQKELARSSRQVSPVSLVPRKHEFEESEEILSVCRVVEGVVLRGFSGGEPIVGKRNRAPRG